MSESSSPASPQPPQPPPLTQSVTQPVEAAVASATTAAAAATTTTTTTQWEEAYLLWKNVDMKSKMSSWDEAFGQVVAHKEANQAERGKLVSYVKEFTASYKTEPTAQKVEELLRFFKRFVQALYDRIGVSEKNFLGIYQSFATAPDPAPLFLSAHIELSAQHRRNVQLSAKLDECKTLIEELRKQLLVATSGNANSSNSSSSSSGNVTASNDVQRLERIVDDLNARIALDARERDALRAELARMGAALSAAQDAAMRAAAEVEQLSAARDAAVEDLEAEVVALTEEAAALRRQVTLASNNASKVVSQSSPSQSSRAAKAGEQLGGEEEGAQIDALRDLAAETKRRAEAEAEAALLRRRVAELEGSVRLLQLSAPHHRGATSATTTTEAEAPGSIEGAKGGDPDAAGPPGVHGQLLAEKRRARALQFDLENQTTRHAEATKAAELTIATLRRQVDELRAQLGIPCGGSAGSAGSAGSGGGVTEPLSAVPPVDDIDFSFLLAGERASATTATTTNATAAPPRVSSTAQDDATLVAAAAPGDQSLVGALILQRNQLKAKLEASERTVGKLRGDLLEISAKFDDAMRANAALQQLVHDRDGSNGTGGNAGTAVVVVGSAAQLQDSGSDPPPRAQAAFDAVFDWRQQSARGGASSSAGRTSTPLASLAAATAAQQQARRDALGVVDHVAVIIASMIVKSSTMRTILVVYLLSLHCLLFGVMYYTSANYFHHTTVLKAAPRGVHSGSIHGLIGQGAA